MPLKKSHLVDVSILFFKIFCFFAICPDHLLAVSGQKFQRACDDGLGLGLQLPPELRASFGSLYSMKIK